LARQRPGVRWQNPGRGDDTAHARRRPHSGLSASSGLPRAASPMPGAPGISAAALRDAGAIFIVPDPSGGCPWREGAKRLPKRLPRAFSCKRAPPTCGERSFACKRGPPTWRERSFARQRVPTTWREKALAGQGDGTGCGVGAVTAGSMTAAGMPSACALRRGGILAVQGSFDPWLPSPIPPGSAGSHP
jgi:hypothetical protein